VGSYFLLSLWFPVPPCDAGQSDIPNPVLTLVSLSKPSRNGGSLSAGSHAPLSFPICLWTRFAQRSALPGPMSRCPLLLEPTKCPEPLCPIEALPRSARSLLHRVGGRYPSFLAPTDSCARPSSSHLLDSRLVWWVFAGCHQSLLDAGPSRRCLCLSFLGCLAPYPGVSPGAFARFFPEDSGLPPSLTGSALPHLTRTATSVRETFFGAAGIPLCSGLQVCSPPRSLRPIPPLLYGRRGFYFRASYSSLPLHTSDMLTARIGQLAVGDLHPIRLAALSATPKS
jgi:hypothetical protein